MHFYGGLRARALKVVLGTQEVPSLGGSWGSQDHHPPPREQSELGARCQDLVEVAADRGEGLPGGSETTIKTVISLCEGPGCSSTAAPCVQSPGCQREPPARPELLLHPWVQRVTRPRPALRPCPSPPGWGSGGGSTHSAQQQAGPTGQGAWSVCMEPGEGPRDPSPPVPSKNQGPSPSCSREPSRFLTVAGKLPARGVGSHSDRPSAGRMRLC